VELQVSKLERKRFIICYLSYYSFIGLVYYSLKIIFMIDLGGKDRKYFGEMECFFAMNLFVVNQTPLLVSQNKQDFIVEK